ncbi:hypothetical protein DFP72DRAFT_820488, partial [Ephemerocybe angulata]
EKEDWPDGDVIKEVLVESLGAKPKQELNNNKWVWNSIGYPQRDRTEVRACQGVFICSGCRRPCRPAVKAPSQREQLRKGCGSCGSALIVHECKDARVYMTVIPGEEGDVLRWEHRGKHAHPRPPPSGRLSHAEQAALDLQVLKNPSATAHQLRTGTLNSTPLHAISPSLVKPSAARYQIEKSRALQGIITASTSKGGFSFIDSLTDLKDKHGNPFMISATLVGEKVLMFQTPFMRDALVESINEWTSDDSHSEGRHGLVTDGNHSFFREGVLLVTCVFLTKTATWTPVLLTWIGGQNTEHHQPHFRHIFRFILEKAGKNFEKKFLANVMDFSAAQRKAHAIEYAEVIIKTMGPLFGTLDKKAQKAQREALIEEASAYLLGCDVHFRKSVVRIRDTAALIPTALIPKFTDAIAILTSMDTTELQFDAAFASLEADFPAISGWLKWWAQPWVMSMAFPAKSRVASQLRLDVPRTSNPVEHQHSLINHACGYGHDLVAGVTALLKHIEEREAQYRAIEGGVYDATGPRAPSRKKGKKSTYENDGRAPDTAERLKAAASARVPALQLMSYKWLAPNTCFLDASLEVWFRGWMLWSEFEQNHLREKLPADSFLSFLTSHYRRRAEKMLNTDSPNSKGDMAQELALGQGKAMSYVIDKWKRVLPGEYYCAVSWLHWGIKDGDPCLEAQAHFGVHHHVVRHCSKGHISFNAHPETDPMLPTPITTIELAVTSIVGELYPDDPATPAQYLTHYLPRNAGSTSLVHETCLAARCTHPECTDVAPVTGIRFSWPKMLTLNTSGAVALPDQPTLYPTRLTWPEAFSIIDPVDYQKVEYQMAGLVYFGGQHYTADVRVEGKTYHYNSIFKDRKIEYSPLQSMTKKVQQSNLKRNPAGAVYVRTSRKSTVCMNLICFFILH